MHETDRTVRQLDLAVAALLFGATVLYLLSWPRDLGFADESYFLYEAKRIRDGEVMYRDVFQFVAPLTWHLMAGLFWLFGTDLIVARVCMALLHGTTAALCYACARSLGVRRSLAVLPPLAYLALCHGPWPYASPHWFATDVVVLILLIGLRGRWAEQPRAAVRLGAVVGLLIGIQQQKGAVITAAVGVMLLLDPLTSRRWGARPVWRPMLAQGLRFAAGVFAVVVPLAIVMVAVAGSEPVFNALISYPLLEYEAARRVAWGATGVLGGGYMIFTWPRLLKWVPLVMAPLLALTLLDIVRGANRRRARQHSVLLLVCAGSAGSVLYYPDFIHLAFIAPPFFIAAVALLEWGLRALRPAWLARGVEWAVAAVLVLALGRQLADNQMHAHANHTLRHQTAFGLVDFSAPWELVFADTLRALLDRTESREMFGYPSVVAPYLLAGGRNPTPYQHLTVRDHKPWRIQQVMDILRTRRPPYVVTAPLFLNFEKDPIARYIDAEYRFVDVAGLTPIWLYARKDLEVPDDLAALRAPYDAP